MAEGSVTIKITGDTGNIEAKLKQLEAKIKQLGTATDAVSSLMGSGTAAAASALNELGSSADSAASAVDEFANNATDASTASEDMSDSVKGVGSAAEDAESGLSEMDDATSGAADSMEDLNESGKGSTEQINGLGETSEETSNDVDKLGKSSEETSDSVDGLGDSANQTSGKFASFKTMVASILAADAVKKFVDKSLQALKELASNVMETGISFDTAMSQVAATMGTTTEQIAELETTAKNLGSTTAFTATEAAEGLNILAQSGLSAQEQIAAIPDVLNLAAAGATSLDNAASYVTGTIKGFGDSMDNAQYYADLMAKGATLANTNVSGLGEALSDASATAETYGQSADSVTLSLLRLAEQNVVGTEASTALSRAMMDLYTPTDTAKAALDDLGVAVYDSSGKARDFNDVVDDLNNALSGMSDEQKLATANTIFTTYGLDAFNKMTKTSSDKVDEFKSGLAKASEEFNGLGAAAGQAETQLDNLGGDITIFQSATEGLYNAIYEKIEPAARLAVQGATSIISGMTSVLTDGAEQTKVSGERVVLQFLNGLTAGLPNVLEAGTQAVENFLTGTIANIPSLATSALRVILAWAMYLRLGATSIISAGAELITTLAEGIGQHLPEIVQAAVDTITGFVSSLIDNLPQIASTAVAIVSNLASTITQNVPTILAAGVTLILSLLGGIIQSIPSVLEGVATLVTNICDKIGSTDWISVGINIITTLASGISGAVSFVGEATMAIVDAVVNYFSEHGNDWFEAGKNIVLGLKDGIVSLVTAPVDAINGVCDGILNKVLTFFGIASPSTVMAEQGMYIDQGLGQGITDNQASATTPAATMAQAVFDAAKGILSTASSIGSGFISFLSNGISSSSGTASGASKGVASAAASSASSQKNVFSTAGKTVGSAFSTGIQSVKSAVSSAAKVISTAGHTAASALKSQYQTAGKTVITSFQKGISAQRSAVSSAAKAIAAAGHAAANATKSSWSSVGGNLASGLASGISRGASTVISAAAGIAKRALSAAKSALGIRSPSRVMRDQVGVMISRGVAVGMAKAESYVSDAANDLSESVVDNFSPTVDVATVNARKKVSVAALDNVRAMLLADNYAVGRNMSTAYTTNNVYNDGGRVVHIDFHPETKCDEPISARKMYAINNENARQLRRSLARV